MVFVPLSQMLVVDFPLSSPASKCSHKLESVHTSRILFSGRKEPLESYTSALGFPSRPWSPGSWLTGYEGRREELSQSVGLTASPVWEGTPSSSQNAAQRDADSTHFSPPAPSFDSIDSNNWKEMSLKE